MLLNVTDLCKTYPGRPVLRGGGAGAVTAVHRVSLSIIPGETLGLVGESGCGKSTIARLILRLDHPDSGSVHFRGQDVFALRGQALKRFRRRVQIVFQDPFSSLNPRMRIGSIVGEPLTVHRIGTRRDRPARVAELMAQVGLQPEWSHRYPHEFSSGQRQRVGIARALSLGPELIIADEPVSALDVSIQAQTLNLLMDLQERLQLTYLFISHDLSVVRFISSRVAVMYLGTIVETAPTEGLYAEPLHPYTESLLAAVPVPDPQRRRRQAPLQGDAVTQRFAGTGCVFLPRCPIGKRSVCDVAPPPLEEKRPGHFAACFLR